MIRISMRCTLVALVAVVPALWHPLPAQQSRVQQVRTAAETIVAANLMRDVSYLASDAMKGRATPSPGLDSAAAFIVRRLTGMHVKPVGDNGTYYQHYTVRRATLDTSAVSISVSGDQLRWGSDFVVTSFVTPGKFTGGVVYVGNGIRLLKRGVDPYAGLDVRGRWIVTHAGSVPRARAVRDSMGVAGLDYTTVLDEARARGALGILIIPNTATIGGWNAARSRVPMGRDLDPTLGRAYAPFPLPQISLAPAAVERLFAGSGLRAADLMTADSTRRYPASIGLARIGTVTVDLAATSTSVQAFNVVGLIEGSDPKLRTEWVTSSTHLDGAVGRAVTPSGDSVYNAADDNGSGSAANLSIAAALLAAPRPKRSVLLVWDSGEETGLWGSRFLAYGPLADKVVAHFTVDMIARTKTPGTNIQGQDELSGPGEVYVSGPAVLSSELDSVLARTTRDYHFITLNRKYEDPAHEFFYPRTDAAPYIERGIPYMEFFTGLHEDYHRQTDEVAKFDPEKYQAVARTVFVNIWTVADDPVRPRIDKPVPSVLWFMTPKR
jgi:hypothetical protein